MGERDNLPLVEQLVKMGGEEQACLFDKKLVSFLASSMGFLTLRKRKSPLYVACEHGHVQIVTFLLPMSAEAISMPTLEKVIHLGLGDYFLKRIWEGLPLPCCCAKL